MHLGDNASFELIWINAGTLASGTLDLNLIGTNTSGLGYVFPGGFTVASGATLAVGPNVPLYITPGQTFADNGSVSFGCRRHRAVAVELLHGRGCDPPIGGTLTADDMTFTNYRANQSPSITVESGGTLVATDSTFNISQLSFNNSSVLSSGDLTGDVFNTPVYVPYGDIQYLGDNASFELIWINAGTLAGGTCST